ncbi:MAG: methylmalonyl Co-A mutase-associated GTPase MeaB [Deltaproteobacteria bacterium]|nr:methylmalonyl Co-A mutase-associated GTPase MeaB [Deltaproteobacteria bacterium]
MKFSNEELIQKVPAHDLRAVARLITLSENRSARAREVQSKLFEKTGRAHIIGVTGSPGAGKSTLVDQLASNYIKLGKKVGIVAVDPTSPFTGGAVLGDRVRMSNAAELDGVFIRSMATRGALGGLSRATSDAIQIMDAAGFDVVIVETVGVGQAEVDIVRTADTCFVVLVPGMGDGVQAIKAGILEIADVFVINKADREGADALHKDIRVLLGLGDHDQEAWMPPIVKTVATKAEGIGELIEAGNSHREWLTTSGRGAERRLMMMKEHIIKTAHDILGEKIILDHGKELEKSAKDCIERKVDPFSVAQKLLD